MGYGRSSYGVFFKNFEDLQLSDKPWVRDGTTPFEFKIMSLLKVIAESGTSIDGEPAFLRIKDMPFLETIEYGDLLILKGLASSQQVYLQRIVSHPSLRDGITDEGLASSQQVYLQRIISHPSLRDGITDEWASLFSVVPDVVSTGRSESYRLELLDILFDPEQTLLEERTITLPLAGDIQLTVIGPGVRASSAAVSRAMDTLEQVIRSQEEFMGVAFPQNHVTLVVDDLNRFGGSWGMDTIILAGHSNDHEIIMHKTADTYWADWTWTAHTYWADWTWLGGEGTSFLRMISLQAYDGTPLPDSEAGRGIFGELYNRLGEEAFRRGFGELYLALHNDAYNDSYDVKCPGDDWGACYLRTAFVEGSTPEQAAIVKEIVARRYGSS